MKKFIFFSLLCASCQSYAMYDALFEELNEQNAPAVIGLRNKIHNHIPPLSAYAAERLHRPTVEGTRTNKHVFEQLDRHLNPQNHQELSLYSSQALSEAIELQDAAPIGSYAAKDCIQSPDQLWLYLTKQKEINAHFFMHSIRENIPENTPSLLSLLDHLDRTSPVGTLFDRDMLLILYARYGKLEKFKQLFDKSTQENQLSDYPTFLPIVQECLQQAIDNDQVDVVQFLVENPVACKDIASHRLNLSKVAQKGSAVIEYFLTSAKPVFSRDYYISVFNTAAQHQNIKVCEMLYQHGIRPSDYYVQSYSENAYKAGDFQWASTLKKYRAGIEKK